MCGFSRSIGEITYLSRHPNGAHVTEAIKNLGEGLSDDVINFANATGGDQYEVESRTELRKQLASLQAALAKVSAPEKSELLKKLQRISHAAAQRRKALPRFDGFPLRRCAAA